MAFLIGGANSAADTGFDVANSCRFNDGDSAYMSRTLGTPTDPEKWTWSCWVKRSTLGATQTLFSYDSGSTLMEFIGFNSTDSFRWYHRTSGGTVYHLNTNRYFQDVSAWYHLLVVYDSSQGTDSNRVKFFVNGTQETSFATSAYPAQDLDSELNKANAVKIYSWNGSEFFDGYIAENVFCDGQAYTTTDFGEFDSDSPTIWKPIDPSGLTFGTNGFYLDFEDSANLGNDANGGTDWSETNLAATDQSTDTCTNNFATINSLDKNLTTFSEGNLKLNWSQSAGTFGLTTGTIGITAGKWYWEAKITSADNSTGVGLGVIQTEPYLSRETATGVDSSLFYGLGARFTTAKSVTKTSNSVDTSISDTWSNDDIIRIAYDGDAGKIYMWMGTDELNGQTFSTPTSFNDATLTAETLVLPFVSLGDGGSGTKTSQVEFNFGGTQSFSIASGNADANSRGNFEYSVPSGYLSLCTKNLGSDGG